MQATSMLELWGSVHGTINPLQNRHRSGDLEKFATLGIKKIQYPFHWESIARNHPEQLEDPKQWEWIDRKMEEFKYQHLQPIAAFIHSGSGPRYTNLIDPEFPEKIARYAKKFSERYPWVEDYIPIHEPLATARLADKTIFFRALYNEVKGIILSMRAIWKVNPQARLIMTDDLGQTDFENDRRWLSFDLLNGLIRSSHPLYGVFIELGFSHEEMDWMIKNSIRPDLIGINPAPESIFLEAWNRYQIPIAITEVHTSGGREYQLRWLQKVWNSALSARVKGADIQAVTLLSPLSDPGRAARALNSPPHYFEESRLSGEAAVKFSPSSGLFS